MESKMYTFGRRDTDTQSIYSRRQGPRENLAELTGQFDGSSIYLKHSNSRESGVSDFQRRDTVGFRMSVASRATTV
jgi:hypothetical protein